MDVARLPAWGMGKTLHIDHNNGSPPMEFNHWFLTEVSWKELNSLSLVWDQTEVNREDMLLGYKGNSQPFDAVIWFIIHIIVTLLYMCAYVEIEHPIRIMQTLNFFFYCGLNFRRLKEKSKVFKHAKWPSKWLTNESLVWDLTLSLLWAALAGQLIFYPWARTSC